MAGSTSEDNGGGSSIIEGMTSERRCMSADSLAEWRSCEQVENGTPSTSPPYWDTDEDDEDKGAKPSVLYGKFTWKIENFSQINKRELRSNTFVVGGYKWYILIYPQGCDVSNHLSLFLCVANHDKLLPGWSHFAQFTIAVVNKDPKKSKYSDTLHRFWKKEHDWGWKKFMELSKVSDGFIVADTLVIKAQVQVIREKANRLFRCLDRHYRRELVRVYLSNVEQICRRFVEERRGKLSKLIEDKMRWSSFRTFWLGVDQNSKRRMSRDKYDTILKVVVKHFFIEKEVTSTLVMDSLYSGLKALECQSKNKTERVKLVDLEDLPTPMVHVEKDMFVLADDVLLLLERAALEPLPHQVSSPKDDKGPQNRTKDGSSGDESNKDFIERDERCLTELGRRTVEIFILAHIFSSSIEIAYQEAVALKRQEELIREEAAGQAENELKAKRSATEKEKRAKKKQAKQKRNTRKGKDRGRDEKSDLMMQDTPQPENPSDRRLLEDFSSRQAEMVFGNIKTMEDTSDVSDTGDDLPSPLQPDLDDKDVSSVNGDTNSSEIHPAMDVSGSERQNGQTEKRSSSTVDDNCSTCSTVSGPSVAMNGQHKGNSLPYKKSQMSPARSKNQRSRDTHDRTGLTHGGINPSSETTSGDVQSSDVTNSCRDSQPEPVPVLSLKDDIQIRENHLVEKEEDAVVQLPQEEVAAVQKKSNIQDQGEVERPPNSRTVESSSSPTSPGKKPQFGPQPPKQSSENRTTAVIMSEIVSSKQLPSITPTQTEKTAPPATKSPQLSCSSNSETQKLTMSSSKSTATHPVPAVSRPLSAPLIPSPRPTVPIVSTAQTAAPLLSRSVSAAGRLGVDPSPSTPSYVPQSYRNAIVGKTSMGACPAGFPPVSSTSSSHPVSYSQSPAYPSSVSMLPPQSSARNGPTSLRPGLTFGSVKPETLHSQHLWNDDRYSYQETSTSGALYGSNFESDIGRLDIYGRSRSKLYSGEVSDCSQSCQTQGAVSDEFPHLAIINDLLDDDQSISKSSNGQHHSFNQQYTFTPDATTADTGSLSDPRRFDQNEQYYGENFQRVYGSSNGPFHGVRDAHLEQMEFSAYTNGHIDGAIQNHWPYHHADPSMLNLGGTDANMYSYQVHDYLNSSYAENGGYNMYRSSNGI